MSPEERPAADNIAFLEQGIRLIRKLDDDSFARTPDGPFRGGVGSQFRHCLDFYRCFLRDLETGRIDYGRRQRDSTIESSRARAEEEAREVIRALAALETAQVEARLQIRSELKPGDDRPTWNDSSVGRELQFLLSHTVHHYALISVMLAREGFRFEAELAEFGVAPSTLHHWQER